MSYDRKSRFNAFVTPPTPSPYGLVRKPVRLWNIIIYQQLEKTVQGIVKTLEEGVIQTE